MNESARGLTNRSRATRKPVSRHVKCLLSLDRREQSRRRRRFSRTRTRQARCFERVNGTIKVPETASRLVIAWSRKNWGQTPHPSIMRCISLFLRRRLLRKAAEGGRVNDPGGVLGPIGIEFLEGRFHLLCISIQFLLGLRHEIAVDIVPAVRVFRECYLVPSRDIALDEIDPELGVVFLDVGRLEFEGALEEDI